ncbi:MAG: hypothetical protein ACKOCX_00710 [Planctomycetota bacterium]
MRNRGRATAGRAVGLAVAAVLAWPVTVVAEPAAPAAEAGANSLAEREADLLARYRDLERSFLRLADLLAASDPRRAAVLRDAFEQAREAEVGDRLGRIVTLLEEGQLLAAGTSQETAVEQFRGLLDLLEEAGGDRNRADTKREVRQFLSRIAKLIARQRDIEGSTEAGDDDATLATRQREAAEAAAELAGDVGEFARAIDERPGARGQAKARDADEAGDREAGPGDEPQAGDAEAKPAGARQAGGEQQPAGQPMDGSAGDGAAADQEPTGDDEPARAERTRRRLAAAERRMQEAERRLHEAERKAARAEQQRAIEELETARAELEEILRQMREEEVERLLVQLETRVRTMLKAEREIVAAAGKLAAAEAMSRREVELEAARLGREQEAVTAEADRALTLVRDDGSAVAIPEALGQVRDDSAQVATRLARGDLAPATLGIAGDIVTGLEELLAALEKSRREDEQRQDQAGPGGGRPAEPGEQPLVDKLAELKMLRSLQARVNARTERFATLLDAGAEEALEAELVAALGRLADRQRAIERAARDIVAGRTER